MTMENKMTDKENSVTIACKCPTCEGEGLTPSSLSFLDEAPSEAPEPCPDCHLSGKWEVRVTPVAASQIDDLVNPYYKIAEFEEDSRAFLRYKLATEAIEKDGRLDPLRAKKVMESFDASKS